MASTTLARTTDGDARPLRAPLVELSCDRTLTLPSDASVRRDVTCSSPILSTASVKARRSLTELTDFRGISQSNLGPELLGNSLKSIYYALVTAVGIGVEDDRYAVFRSVRKKGIIAFYVC